MTQSYKNIYFQDYPQMVSGRSSLTLAFGKNDHEIYEAVRYLSSDTLRDAIGYQRFAILQDAAQEQRKSVNAFCLSILRKRLKSNEYSDVPCLPGFETKNPILMDPIQATFSGGHHEPMHNWYPYLEGYSPAFVETVIGTFCHEARSILDPFSGTGTTPLTASLLGKRSYYSEINPVLQFLTASKIIALRLNDRERDTVVTELLSLEEKFEQRLKKIKKDVHIKRTYKATFTDSVFFDENVFDDVLRCRTLIDEIGYTQPVLARFLTVAVLRSLIPVSRLIRRGDLRFKKDQELSHKRVDLCQEVCQALQTIVCDLKKLPSLEQIPILILENAKNLDRVPMLSIDAVITSPPYLNGTNYFRNTKIELWFLRCLNQKSDLAKFRFGSMTVGINDVTVKKPIGDMPSSASSILHKLEHSAYDSRIPRMVACFASEMHSILQTLARHTRKRGTIVIDIGDSAYAGVHVPTDKFIVESLCAAGFDLHDEFVLRQRYSRSQIKLTQKLLLFKSSPNRHMRTRSSVRRSNGWSHDWKIFKERLPHQQGEYGKRNWGHPLHSLCSYQGKMKPSLAAHLVRTFTTSGDKMLDPFSGVGTIPFEAALYGVESWGFDISPPAIHITAAKIGKCSTRNCEKLLKRIEKYLQENGVDKADLKVAKTIRFNGELKSYFHKKTFNEILVVRRFFMENPPSTPSESLVFASLLHILHGNRPYALSRRSHPITPFAPTGDTEYRALIPRLRDKVERSLVTPIPDGFLYGHSISQDATKRWPEHINQLDAVITSPPFFDSTRFYMGNWMRLWFCGWEANDFKERPMVFMDERQKRSFGVYNPIFRQCRERLKSGGVVVFHLGASKKCDMARELARIAKIWFRVADIYTESVAHCESHGIRDKGAVASHQYLVLQ